MQLSSSCQWLAIVENITHRGSKVALKKDLLNWKNYRGSVCTGVHFFYSSTQTVCNFLVKGLTTDCALDN